MRANKLLIGKSTNCYYDLMITTDFHPCLIQDFFNPGTMWWICPPTANPRYAEAIDYYYVYGPSVDAIIGGYRELLDMELEDGGTGQ